MNKILFFDTETTGLPKNYHVSPKNSDNWPRLIQFGYLLCDKTKNIIEKDSFLIKPNGFIIPRDASIIHNITTEKALKEGKNLDAALDMIENIMLKANILVGHNIDFDINIIDAEYFRRKNKLFISHISTQYTKIDTMKSSQEFCAIPGYYGYKYPKLEELYRKLFNKDIINTHDALADVEATYKCFWELVKKDIIEIPLDKHTLEKNIKAQNVVKNKLIKELPITLAGATNIRLTALDKDENQKKYDKAKEFVEKQKIGKAEKFMIKNEKMVIIFFVLFITIICLVGLIISAN